MNHLRASRIEQVYLRLIKEITPKIPVPQGYGRPRYVFINDFDHVVAMWSRYLGRGEGESEITHHSLKELCEDTKGDPLQHRAEACARRSSSRADG